MDKEIKFYIKLTCLVVVVFFGILIFKQIAPKSYQEKYNDCLNLGSNMRTSLCLQSLSTPSPTGLPINTYSRPGAQ